MPAKRNRLNRFDAFSHSAQCDDFLSCISPEPGGVKHERCLCWCHGFQVLYASPEPEYDLTPPPGYETTADVYTRIESLPPPNLEPLEDFTIDPFEIEIAAESYAGRSREELVNNRCSTCGDPLNACECVE